MRKAIFVAVLGMVAIGATTLAGAGAAATGPNLSSPDAIKAYLTSIGVDPSKAVWQTSTSNYVGPAAGCPGRGWSCAKPAGVVVQIGASNGQNINMCSSNSSARCIEIQTGAGTNVANCFESSSDPNAVEDCTIVQQGPRNIAVVNQLVNSSGSPQNAVQTADVTQSQGTNHLNLHQTVGQSATSGDPQSEDGHQIALVKQCTGSFTTTNCDATGGGTNSNSAGVHQKQRQTETGATTGQAQNTAGLGSLTDCFVGIFGDGSPTTPNVCAYISQDSDAGMNDNHLDQAIDQLETTTGNNVTQAQNTATGGLDGAVHQGTNTGTSLNHTVQRKQQQMRSAGGSQTQYDPISCCGFISQDGGTNNRENIDQSATLSAAGSLFPFQSVDMTGLSKTDGTCSVGQHARIDGASSSTQESTPPPCGVLLVTTTCSSASGFDEPPANCTPTVNPPVCGITIICDCIELCIVGPNNPTVTTLDSTPTYGQLLAPLDLSDQALSSG